jgi:hypothetical protein
MGSYVAIGNYVEYLLYFTYVMRSGIEVLIF